MELYRIKSSNIYMRLCGMYYCKTVLLEIDAAARTKSPWLMRWHIWIVGTFSQKHFSKGWTLAKGTCRSGSPWDSQYSWTDTACKWVRLDHPQIPQSMIRIYYHTPAASSEDQGAWVCAHHQLHRKLTKPHTMKEPDLQSAIIHETKAAVTSRRLVAKANQT